ncbi:MAG: sugar phosphate isomerase/epimerase [Armatimonadetes bacterium]|nr:sugar phosphate isomerase/epimerase [Armatimonadota bacterium]
MLLKSLNYWSLPGGLDGTLAAEDCLDAAHRHGFAAVELCISEAGALGLDTTEARCREILAYAEKVGVAVASMASGLYWNYALGSDSEADRERAVVALEKMIQITAWLDARTLLTIPGAVDVFFQPGGAVISYDAVWERSTAGLKQVLPIAERLGVTLAIENVWNKFLTSPLEMARFIDQFDSRFIGAYVDVANILPYGYPEQWLRILGSRVRGVHFKDFRRAVGTVEGFVDLLEGDVDFPAVMTAIAEIGYQGPIAAEMIPPYRHYPDVRIANTSRAMDAIFAGQGLS